MDPVYVGLDMVAAPKASSLRKRLKEEEAESYSTDEEKDKRTPPLERKERNVYEEYNIHISGSVAAKRSIEDDGLLMPKPKRTAPGARVWASAGKRKVVTFEGGLQPTVDESADCVTKKSAGSQVDLDTDYFRKLSENLAKTLQEKEDQMTALKGQLYDTTDELDSVAATNDHLKKQLQGELDDRFIKDTARASGVDVKLDEKKEESMFFS